MADKVELEIKGHLATITLNKPERLNALDVEMWEAIGEAASDIDAAPDVRVAVLKGAGGAFCAGLDVKAGSTLSALALDGHHAGRRAPASRSPAVLLQPARSLPRTGHRCPRARVHRRRPRAGALLRHPAGRQGHCVLDSGGPARNRARHGRHTAVAAHDRH